MHVFWTMIKEFYGLICRLWYFTFHYDNNSPTILFGGGGGGGGGETIIIFRVNVPDDLLQWKGKSQEVKVEVTFSC